MKTHGAGAKLGGFGMPANGKIKHRREERPGQMSGGDGDR